MYTFSACESTQEWGGYNAHTASSHGASADFSPEYSMPAWYQYATTNEQVPTSYAGAANNKGGTWDTEWNIQLSNSNPAARWCPPEQNNMGSVWGESSPPYQRKTLAQQNNCQRCGKDDSCAAGDFHDGLWYCVACWRQFELENCFSSDEEEASDEVDYGAKDVSDKFGKETDDEDGTSVVSSTEVESNSSANIRGAISSGDSDIEAMSDRGISSECNIDSLNEVLSPSVSPIGRTSFRPLRSTSETSPTSWSAQLRLRRQLSAASAGDGQTDTPEETGRAARSLLNKLTVERFDSLCEQILALPLHTEEHLAALVAEVFGKATTEHAFCSMYAQLCARLDAHLKQNDDDRIGGRAFRTAVLNECQATFERNLRAGTDRAALEGLEGDEVYEMQVKLKRGRLGNMRFLGELLIRKLLATRVVLSITQELLETTGDGGVALESLIALLQIVGPHFEDANSSASCVLKDVYELLRRRSKDETLSSRIRFHIRDLLDLRARGWSEQKPEQPTTANKVASTIHSTSVSFRR